MTKYKNYCTVYFGGTSPHDLDQKWKLLLNNSMELITTELYVKNCGLFVSENDNWLGASPYGVAQDSSDPDQLEFLK